MSQDEASKGGLRPTTLGNRSTVLLYYMSSDETGVIDQNGYGVEAKRTVALSVEQ
jgi:hypothetical protein